MNVAYQMPDWLGGLVFDFVDGPDPAGRIGLAVPGGHTMRVPESLVTKVGPVLPPELPIDSFGLDPMGDLWHHKDDGFWWYGSRMVTWEQLIAEQGEIAIVGTTRSAELATEAGPADPGAAVAVRLDLVEELPAEFDDYNGRRKLCMEQVADGRLLFRVVEGEQYGRASILRPGDAESLAWTILATIHGGGGQ